MTKAEEKALQVKRAKAREAWHRRKKRVGYAAYKKAKAETKARWQMRNAQRHTEHVQNFYERHGLSGREARAKGKDAASAMQGMKKPSVPSPASRRGDTGDKVRPAAMQAKLIIADRSGGLEQPSRRRRPSR